MFKNAYFSPKKSLLYTSVGSFLIVCIYMFIEFVRNMEYFFVVIIVAVIPFTFYFHSMLKQKNKEKKGIFASTLLLVINFICIYVVSTVTVFGIWMIGVLIDGYIFNI